LVRETSLLRIIILDHLGKNLINGSNHSSMELFIAASRTINLYIDEELRYAVSIYMESK